MSKPKSQPKKTFVSPPKEIVQKVWEPIADKWLVLLLAAISFLLYINTIGHQYVLDDDMVMSKNTIVTKGISAIPEILITPYRKGAWAHEEGLYRPLSLVMFATEWQLTPNNPMLGHFLNILLYVLTSVVLFNLLKRWFFKKSIFIPFFIALLYIIHPLHSEVVANIKSRDEILGALFGFLSLAAFYDYSKTDALAKWIVGSFYFLLSVLSKESSLTLFAVIPLSIFFFSNANFKKYLLIVGALSGIVVVYFLLRKMALGSLVNFKSIDVLNNSIVVAGSKINQIATAFVYIGFYLLKFIFPHPLAFDYSYNTIPNATLGDWRFLVSFLVLLAVGVFSIVQFKKKNPIAFGFLFFVLTISLVCNLFVIIEATTADRFLYLPSLGLCIMVVFVLDKLFSFSSIQNANFSYFFSEKKLFAGLFTLLFILFSFKTISRNFDWKDNFTLFTKDKDNNPNSYRCLSAYANELYNVKIKDLQDFIPEKVALCTEMNDYAKRSLTLMPTNFKMWTLLAFGYTQMKDYTNIIATFEEGRKYHRDEPDWVKFHLMGIDAFYKTQQYQKALDYSDTALFYEPKNASILNSKGMVLTDLNKRQEAWDYLQKSLQIDSTISTTWYNLGNWYAKGNEFQKAISSYQKSVVLDKTQVQAFNNMGNCYAILQQKENAIECYQNALALQPDNPDALRNINIVKQQ